MQEPVLVATSRAYPAIIQVAAAVKQASISVALQAVKAIADMVQPCGDSELVQDPVLVVTSRSSYQ